jgi:hypothetical protein
MSRLRIKQSAAGPDQYRADLEFVEGRGAPLTATAAFPFRMTPQDQEDLRWYLEDFLQYPHDPAPTLAARIERRMAEIGTQLFTAVFEGNRDAERLWARLYDRLDEADVEVVTSVEASTAVPWELIRDPLTDMPLALRAPVFVRSAQQQAQRARLPKPTSGAIRILLVICRPGGDSDVPFRSVASQLLKGISEEARATYQLDVLRPPTYEQLARVLGRAKSDGTPYHAVHFDGHGTYVELAEEKAGIVEWLKGLSPFVLAVPRRGKHGFLVFEDPANDKNTKLVDGPTVGKLLAETGVPVLVLNACRSAHAEAPTAPEQAPAEPSPTADNPHAQVRAFGSLA